MNNAFEIQKLCKSYKDFSLMFQILSLHVQLIVLLL